VPVASSISEIEREIWERSKEIDEVVYSLYELDTASEDVLREMYHCNTVSEYLDRLEEYVGVQDVQPE
jgi:peptidoglycan hydrolase CwlO-like protein